MPIFALPFPALSMSLDPLQFHVDLWCGHDHLRYELPQVLGCLEALLRVLHPAGMSGLATVLFAC